MLIVGYGNMAAAMAAGWLLAGHSRAEFTVYHPSRREAAHGLPIVNSWPEARYDYVLLGVKPQGIGDVAGDIAPYLDAGATLISVLAGTSLDILARHFPNATGGIVRLMPNLAAAIGKSASALVACGLSDARRDQVTQMAEGLGQAEWLADESLFDLVTALAGSGPGFLFRFIDTLANGAASLGLPQEQAERLAKAIVEGAASLAIHSPKSPAELAANVASKGGMTQRGLDVLDEEAALQNLVTDCLDAAAKRGREMATELHSSDSVDG